MIIIYFNEGQHSMEPTQPTWSILPTSVANEAVLQSTKISLWHSLDKSWS